MSGSLQTGVLGMKAYQDMLNVTGNNLANANTVGYKGDSITFADMFSQTLSQGTGATATLGGTNPVQIGGGVLVGSVDKNMVQGGFSSTSSSYDLAIDGQGFFVADDGIGSVFTRDGSFGVDSNGYLVDPATGYRIQRTGTVGEDTGIQVPGNGDIQIPFQTLLPGQMTSTIDFSGNLSAADNTPATSVLQADNLTYTLVGGGMAGASAEFADINQLQGFAAGDTISIAGSLRDGTAASGTFTYGAANDGTTLQDLMDKITNTLGGSSASKVSMQNGNLTVSDAQSGYSMLGVGLSSTAQPAAMPTDFDYLTVGGAALKSTNVTIYDAQSNTHNLTATLVKQAADSHVWDLVVNQATGTDQVSDRRIAGITFDENGTYQGVSGADGFGHTSGDAGFSYLDSALALNFPGITTPQQVTGNFGRPGFYDGLTQLGGDSTAGAVGQDGYAAGSLQKVVIDSNGVLSGTFSNGQTLDIAALRIAVFDNPEGLERAGNNYYNATPAAGDVVYSEGTQGRAGSVRQNVLENSNVDIANEFTNLIVAQEGFQVNSRTVRVTNTILQTLASIIS